MGTVTMEANDSERGSLYKYPHGFQRHALLEAHRSGQVRSGQVRFITRPKSRTMRAKRKKRSRANRTKVPK